jgi:arabinan endo-1,5-alpha-L-arabinosidase
MVDRTGRGARGLLAIAVVAVATAGAVAVVTRNAIAAVGCRVDYAVTNQWPGGFGASVTINNLGDPVSGWQLGWTFGAGQTVTQLWNGSFTQSGAQVTVTNAGYNGTIGSGGSTNVGFNGAWSGSNPVPAAFTLNGVACTGATTTPTTTTRAPTTTTRPPTTTTRPPTTSTGPPTTTRPPTTTSPPACPTRTPPPSYPNPGAVSGSTGAHDPTVVKTPSGSYLVAVTGNNLPLKTSGNRTAWSNAGVVWPGGASWTTAYTGGSANLWAPDLSFRNGQYWLYYAASTFGSQRSAIFLATSPTGASGTWTHRGLVIESSTAVNYNAIDPNLVVDQQGQWWLVFGSFWTGIKMIRLDPATGLRSTSDTAVRAVAQRTTAGGAVEAPSIYFRCGFYYLFVSFDLCCRGAQSTYRIMVGRSTSATGPYVDRNGTALTAGGGTQILAAHDSIIGPGHQAVIPDVDADVLFYHYYTSSGASFLGINLLGWDSAGWPFVF